MLHLCRMVALVLIIFIIEFSNKQKLLFHNISIKVEENEVKLLAIILEGIYFDILLEIN